MKFKTLQNINFPATETTKEENYKPGDEIEIEGEVREEMARRWVIQGVLVPVETTENKNETSDETLDTPIKPKRKAKK